MSKPLFQYLPLSWQSGLKRGRNILRRFVGVRRLHRQLRENNPWNIVVGTAGVCEAGWIPTDIEYLNLLHDSDWQLFFAGNSITTILAEHVWEHLTVEQGLLAAQTCHRYLQPGGRLRIAVPDGYHPDPAYIRYVMVNGTGAGAYDHKVLYTHESLSCMLKKAGFSVTLLEFFDANGTFHSRPWERSNGMIHRSRHFDERNKDGRLNYTSLIVDAIKP
jgi:predicted SAM-dependent methyltransferase